MTNGMIIDLNLRALSSVSKHLEEMRVAGEGKGLDSNYWLVRAFQSVAYEVVNVASAAPGTAVHAYNDQGKLAPTDRKLIPEEKANAIKSIEAFIQDVGARLGFDLSTHKDRELIIDKLVRGYYNGNAGGQVDIAVAATKQIVAGALSIPKAGMGTSGVYGSLLWNDETGFILPATIKSVFDYIQNDRTAALAFLAKHEGQATSATDLPQPDGAAARGRAAARSAPKPSADTLDS